MNWKYVIFIGGFDVWINIYFQKFESSTSLHVCRFVAISGLFIICTHLFISKKKISFKLRKKNHLVRERTKKKANSCYLWKSLDTKENYDVIQTKMLAFWHTVIGMNRIWLRKRMNRRIKIAQTIIMEKYLATDD